MSDCKFVSMKSVANLVQPCHSVCVTKEMWHQVYILLRIIMRCGYYCTDKLDLLIIDRNKLDLLIIDNINLY